MVTHNDRPEDHRDPLAQARLQRAMRSAKEERIKAEILKLTPEDARYILSLSEEVPHRAISKPSVGRYAQDIRSGKFLWMVCPPLVLDEDFRCWDGRHRLQAIVESGVTCTVAVEVIKSADGIAYLTSRNCNRPMAFADLLLVNGEKNVRPLAAALRLLALWEAGHLTAPSMLAPSYSAMSSVLSRRPEVRAAASARITDLKHPSEIAASRVILGRTKNPKATAFFDSLKTGEKLSADHPIYRLRRRLAKTSHEREMTMPETFAVIFKAWNMYLGDTRCQILVWKLAEPFPIPESCGPWPGQEGDGTKEAGNAPPA